MNTSIVLIIVAAVVIAGIFWLVLYASKRGQKHTMQTSIKPPESQTKKDTA